MNNIFVLDACALLAVVRDEEGADVVSEAYSEAADGNAQIIINRINLLEVYYDFYRHKGKEYADDFICKIENSEVKVCEFDKALFSIAGRLKASYRISLADSIALAQTIESQGELLTCDHHEFDQMVGKEPVKFHWIR